MMASPSMPVGSTGLLAKLHDAVRDSADKYRTLGTAPHARKLLLTAAGSYIGDRFNTIALVAVSFKLGDGALGVGGMLALMAAPRLVVQAASGALVDRHPGKRLLVISQLLMALLAGSYALLAVVHSLWLLYGITLAIGVVRTIDFPAFEVRLMALTPATQRGTANAVHMLAMTAGELIGPLLGGLVLALTGATPLFLLNAVTFVLLARVVSRLPDRLPATGEDAVAASASSPVTDESSTTSALGYRALLARPDILLYTGLVTASCILILGTIPLLIVRAHDLGLGESGVGIFYATMGVGTLLGSMVAGAGDQTTRRALGMSAIVCLLGSLSLLLFGAVGTLLLALPALVIFGITGALEEVYALTYFQHDLPDAIYGRFFSLFLMATGAGGLIGALAGPILADGLGVGTALVVLAVPVLVLGVLFGVKEGGLRFALPPLPPLTVTGEPEVVGHGLLGVPSPSDLLPDGAVGGPLLPPRLRRLV